MIYKLSLYATMLCPSLSTNDALSFTSSHLTPSLDFQMSFRMPEPLPPVRIMSPLNDTAPNADRSSNGACLWTRSHYRPSSDFQTSLFLVPAESSPAMTYMNPLWTKLACLNLGENAALAVIRVHSVPFFSFHTSLSTPASPFPPMI